MPFFGRTKELHDLKELLNKKASSLVVIRGRRRVGKTRLVEEFSKSFPKKFFFAGLAPENPEELRPGINNPTLAQKQRDAFADRMYALGIPCSRRDEWSSLFTDVAKYCLKGRLIVFFDEITWLGMGDPSFLGKLKTAWDFEFSKNEQLILVLAGSNSAWIEKNILTSSGFVGRIAWGMELKELPLHVCDQFWGPNESQIAPYEKFKILSVTGGIPRYLEEIQPLLTAEQNIQRLCFDASGLLFNEFNNIFSDIFGKRSERYEFLVKFLVDGPASLEKIAQLSGRDSGGDLSEALEELTESGIISRDFTWHLRDGKASRLSQYRLSDNYLRFYLKFIEPQHRKIKSGHKIRLPSNWYAIMGLQFENLVVSSRQELYRLLDIQEEEIVCANPYWHTASARRKACQIDFLIQTKFNVLYVCEVKFYKKPISTDVVSETREKIARLQAPKGFSYRPVLIHVNGVEDAVIDKEYFAHVLDFGQLLTRAPN
ncbi:MAG: AAA family ATPase [Verrucomicrobia bacterium]|nr:AAA family ATPase [Verrucomicrobiota bacterium]